MSEPRPLPEYGEYATPEQQAAAMGRVYVPPPDPATRIPLAPPASDGYPTPPAPTVRTLLDRLVTLFELGLGFAALLGTDFSRLAENTNTGLVAMGSSQRVSLAIDHYSWFLLGANIVLLLASTFWAYAALRRGRLAFYIPIVGFLALTIVLVVVEAVVD
jgi:hypothetical protein